MNGIELITQERIRQIEKEKWTPEHDDDGFHRNGELAYFACCYASPKPIYKKVELINGIIFADPYPDSWDKMWDKRQRKEFELIANKDLPNKDRIRNLVKAGALIAAEIDRLQRLEK